MPIPKDQIMKIRLGKTLTPHPGHDHYVVSYGSRPQGPQKIFAPHLVDADRLHALPAQADRPLTPDELFAVIRDAHAKLNEPGRSLPLDKGPFADQMGVIANRIPEIVRGRKNLPVGDLIDTVVDSFRPEDPLGEEGAAAFPKIPQNAHYGFTLLRPYRKVPDILPVAGQILTQPERRQRNPMDSSSAIMQVHMMEAYCLATSFLRHYFAQQNHNPSRQVYPAIALSAASNNNFGLLQHFGLPFFSSADRQVFLSPIIALVDLTQQAPMSTFALKRAHPPVGRVDLLSDMAMMGILHIIHAEIKLKLLTDKIATRAYDAALNPSATGISEDRVVPEEEIERTFRRIAEQIVKAYTYCPELVPFVQNTFHFIDSELLMTFATLEWLDCKTVSSGNPFVQQMDVASFAQMVRARDPNAAAQIEANAERTKKYFMDAFARIVTEAVVTSGVLR
ncbi:hypothetical protein HY988_07760 [Candidatus Micrarchaeota archaeon]|nr:hypothetical protein [Candidatus Micrarchaeota archaeon]